jgi:PIN domain nuclease of toxin-antitoxin system
VLGALLDSHTLYWLVSGEAPLSEDALIAIGEAQEAGNLYVSPVTAWELTLAARKPAQRNPPVLGLGTPQQWFREAVRAIGARLVPIQQKIAFEAAAVVATTGHRDPGDCFLIATARVRRIPIITRDGVILGLAAEGYLDVIEC